jgi:predicted dehydrogenase
VDSLRAAVIGLGVGEQHILGYRSHPRCEVVAICDISPERLEAVGARHPGVRRTSRPEEVLEDPDIDVVSIASYDDAHYEQVVAALSHGKHVFVEKPLCMREQEAEHVHALLRERPGLRLSSNMPLRRSPKFLLVRRMIEEGELGGLYYLDGDYDYGRLHKLTEGWRGDLPYYSVVLGGAIHMVDLLMWLTRRGVERVSATGNDLATHGTKFRFDDFVLATLEMQGGVIAKVSANFACVHPHFHDLRVFGSKGTFVNGLDGGVVWGREDGRAVPRRIDAPDAGVAKGGLIPGFVDSIMTGSRPEVTPEEVFRTMAVCLAIDRSRESGEPVTVPRFG